MEDDLGSGPSGAAAERQPRAEDETTSKEAAPTVTIVESEAEFATPDDYASRSHPVSRPRLPRQWSLPSSESSWEEETPYVEEVNVSRADSNSPLQRDSELSVCSFERESERSPPSAPLPAGIDHWRVIVDNSGGHVYYSSIVLQPRGRSLSPSEWGTYDIDLDGDELRNPEEPPPQEWTQPRTILDDNTATELIVAQSIEHRVSKSGLERIVLMFPSRPPPSSGSARGQEREKSQVQLRWL
jgi:hypothetical protein